jgi:hypothetical protein
MDRQGVVPLIILCVLLTASLALTQGLPSGTIAGSVTTAADGKPLPGVTVTVRSQALQGVRQAVSAAGGDFLLANLPPGEYTVDLELQGFATVTRAGIRVGTSQRQELAVGMSLKGVTEEVLVTASTDLVSAVPQSATILTSKTINELPIPRTIESAALLAPDISGRPGNAYVSQATDAFSIAGGETYENMINVDGISPQEPYLRLPSLSTSRTPSPRWRR